eukprot:211068_1
MYAATDIEFGMQALDNEAFDTRYKQTFGHPAGLVLFIYSWAATPLWQWIGAVVIFDYKNLASVGRDVDTLVEDGKWNQVLELVSFGAAFNPAKILQKIEGYEAKEAARQIESNQSVELQSRSINIELTTKDGADKRCDQGHQLVYKSSAIFVCNGCEKDMPQSISWHCNTCDYDLCCDCYNHDPHDETKEEGDDSPGVDKEEEGGDPQGDTTDTKEEEDDGPKCPAQPGLTEFKAESDGFCCDICGEKKRKDDVMYGCRECEYDVCAGCKDGVVRLGRCEKGHILKRKPSENKCSRCKRTNNKSSKMVTWHCNDCATYNLCDKCYEIVRDVKSLPPIDQLRLLCEDAAKNKEDKAAGNRLCDRLCSCPMFLAVIGAALLGESIWYAWTYGVQGIGFYLAICPLAAAVVMCFCAVSCCFDLFEKCSECLKKKMDEKKKERKLNKENLRINCRGKHGMTLYETPNDGVSCDHCKKKVGAHIKMYECRECNYDVCTDCKPEPIIEEVLDPVKTPTELDEVVTCPQQHSLIPQSHPRDTFECSDCKKTCQKTKSWHCEECHYDLCSECFVLAQATLEANRNLWLKDTQQDDKPILTYGGFGCLGLIVLVFCLGLDVVAFLVNSRYECDISGGSGYFGFNVEMFLEVGSIIHVCMFGCLAFSVFVHKRANADTPDECVWCMAVYGRMGCGCVAFMLFASEVVIGYLLYSEMTPENVVNDGKCMRMVFWWIVDVSIQVFVLLVIACYQFKSNFETAMKFARIIGIVFAVLTVIGSDIAALTINSSYECDISGGSEHFRFNVDTFFTSSIVHLCVCACLTCIACANTTDYKQEQSIGGMCCGFVAFVFFIGWTYIGFVLHSEMTPKNVVDDAQCIPMVFSWSVITSIQACIIFMMG